MHFFLTLVMAFSTNSALAADSVHSILLNIDTINPDASCPECGLDPNGLFNEAKRLKDVRDKLQANISNRSRSASYQNQNLTDVQLAKQAADQLKILQTEVDRQKILNQLKQSKLNACQGGAAGKGAASNH